MYATDFSKTAFKEFPMLAYSTPEEEFSHAVYLLSQVKKTLDQIALHDPAIWGRFMNRLNEAGADRLDAIAFECDLVSLLVAQDAGFRRANFPQAAEMVQ
jgi:hypothetical protein